MTASTPLPSTHRRAVVVTAGALACFGASAWAKVRSTRHTVLMEATAYLPLELRVSRGDSVLWVNRDPFPHTVTCTGVFDSGHVGVDGRWMYRANVAGRFEYLCVYHPNMKATLVVT
jgi:plastocyanin